MRGHALDLVVGRHHNRRIGRLDGGGEGNQECFAQRALADVGRRNVQPALGRGMDKMLEGDEHSILRERARAALLPSHRSDPHLADEVRVFAVKLFDAAVAGVSRQV